MQIKEQDHDKDKENRNIFRQKISIYMHAYRSFNEGNARHNSVALYQIV